MLKIAGSAKLSADAEDILSGFPRDVRTAAALFRLDGNSTVYATCARCHRTFKPSDVNGIPTYPPQCNSRPYKRGPRCHEPLTRPKTIGAHQVQVPILPFVSFDFKDWIAELVSRPGYEEEMDKSWEGIDVAGEEMSDVFQGAVLRDFLGPDKKTHFCFGGDEGRYVFSLSVDWFNPLTNKQAGKKLSVGVIAVVCLSLPPHLRYKPENMFLAGIIPGPKEPPLEASNPYLKPLVDDFLDFWNPGVFLTRTQKHRTGRRVRCALVAVVCDLPATRKICGLANHSHNYFCSRCNCTRQKEGLNNYNYSSWDLRDKRYYDTNAEKYFAAKTEAAAQSTFDKSGVRWSELLRLPYFDFSRFVVVDSMHNLFLGLFKEHFHAILGYQQQKKSGDLPSLRIVIAKDSSNPLPTKDVEQKSVTKLISWLEKSMSDDLRDSTKFEQSLKRFTNGAHLASLLYVAKGVSCPGLNPGPNLKITKKHVATQLLSWVS